MGIRPFLRFLVVGGIFTAINIILLAILVGKFGVSYLFSCAISFFLLNFFSYIFNKWFTFRLGSSMVPVEVGRYYAVMLVSLALNLVLMYLLVEIFSFHYLIASIATTAILTGLNFFAHHTITFRVKPSECEIKYDVLMVSAFHSTHGGGIEVVADKLSSRLAQDGLRTAWITGSKGHSSDSPSIENGVTLISCNYLDFLEPKTGLPMPIWLPKDLGILWRAISHSNVIHLHDYLYFPCLIANLFARFQRKSVVITQHIGELPLRSKTLRAFVSILNLSLGRWMLKSADQTVFIARPVMDFFSEFTRFGSSPQLIPNGVDHELYKPIEDRRPTADTRLLFVGRFVEKKGIQLLRQCLDIPNTRWTFAGWGPLSPSNWPELPASTTVIERASPNEIVSLYQQSDILVLPSVGEGFPLVVQESLACGTPVLVSEEVAETCPNRDPSCVYAVDVSVQNAASNVRAAIVELISSPENLKQARQRAIDLSGQWSWEACALEYRNIYSRLGELL